MFGHYFCEIDTIGEFGNIHPDGVFFCILN